MENRLAREKSPYLLQHANNPVDWYPWGDEAFRKAKNDGKPVFLSIGYSTCHWCHVMQRESFEDEGTAAFMNRNFIAIKVDREERPEVDAFYMKAVQAMTGGGGWPLSVFLTPDLRPYYGGTYFPPKPRDGMPSFMQVLEFASKVWKERRDELSESTERVMQALNVGAEGPAAVVDRSLLDEGFREMASSLDAAHGGFGGAPKFPVPLTSSFLLRYSHRTGSELALRCVTKTLDEMMSGGIRDHVGGGFHRYSTDRVWLVPHFEKMLYDNAQLAKLYTEAHQATGNPAYAVAATETLDWILQEMTDANGGFYSAQDADTTEGEGVYYTWTPAEAEDALGGDAEEFCKAYGVTQNGNFDGRSILHRERGTGWAGGMDGGWRGRLYAARLSRPRPATDTKVLTSWNGLCISGLATAGAALDRQDYLEAARRASRFVLRKCSKEGGLLRRFAGGEAALDGTLEDYAFFVQGLLDLFEATFEPAWLREAMRLAEEMVERFEDKERGGLYLTEDAGPWRMMEAYDGPTPSGNSAAVMDLLRVGALTGREAQRSVAERVVLRFTPEIGRSPSSHANMLAGVDMLTRGYREVVIVGSTRAATAKMRRAMATVYRPDSVVLAATKESYDELLSVSELLAGRKPGAEPRAYVCRDFACKLPSDSVEVLLNQLKEK